MEIVRQPKGRLNHCHLPLFHLRRIGPKATQDGVLDIMDLTKVTSLLGRNKTQVDFLLDSSNAVASQYISRLHARIVRQDSNSHRLFDDSLNGIFINNTKMQGSVVLREGDVVTFGHPFGVRLAAGVWKRQPDSEYQFIFERCSCLLQNPDPKADTDRSVPSSIMVKDIHKESERCNCGKENLKKDIEGSRHADAEGDTMNESARSSSMHDTFVSNVSLLEKSFDKDGKDIESYPSSLTQPLSQRQCMTNTVSLIPSVDKSPNVTSFILPQSSSPMKQSDQKVILQEVSKLIRDVDVLPKSTLTSPHLEKSENAPGPSQTEEKENVAVRTINMENVGKDAVGFSDFDDSEPGFCLDDIVDESVMKSVLKLCQEPLCKQDKDNGSKSLEAKTQACEKETQENVSQIQSNTQFFTAETAGINTQETLFTSHNHSSSIQSCFSETQDGKSSTKCQIENVSSKDESEKPVETVSTNSDDSVFLVPQVPTVNKCKNTILKLKRKENQELSPRKSANDNRCKEDSASKGFKDFSDTITSNKNPASQTKETRTITFDPATTNFVFSANEECSNENELVKVKDDASKFGLCSMEKEDKKNLKTPCNGTKEPQNSGPVFRENIKGVITYSTDINSTKAEAEPKDDSAFVNSPAISGRRLDEENLVQDTALHPSKSVTGAMEDTGNSARNSSESGNETLHDKCNDPNYSLEPEPDHKDNDDTSLIYSAEYEKRPATFNSKALDSPEASALYLDVTVKQPSMNAKMTSHELNLNTIAQSSDVLYADMDDTSNKTVDSADNVSDSMASQLITNMHSKQMSHSMDDELKTNIQFIKTSQMTAAINTDNHSMDSVYNTNIQSPESVNLQMDSLLDIDTMSLEHDPVSDPVSLRDDPVPDTMDLEHDSVSDSMSSGHDPVSDPVSLKQDPVPDTMASEHDPVSDSMSSGHNPVSDPVSSKHGPVSITTSLEHDPVSDTFSLEQRPVSEEKVSPNVPSTQIDTWASSVKVSKESFPCLKHEGIFMDETSNTEMCSTEPEVIIVDDASDVDADVILVDDASDVDSMEISPSDSAQDMDDGPLQSRIVNADHSNFKGTLLRISVENVVPKNENEMPVEKPIISEENDNPTQVKMPQAIQTLVKDEPIQALSKGDKQLNEDEESAKNQALSKSKSPEDVFSIKNETLPKTELCENGISLENETCPENELCEDDTSNSIGGQICPQNENHGDGISAGPPDEDKSQEEKIASDSKNSPCESGTSGEDSKSVESQKFPEEIKMSSERQIVPVKYEMPVENQHEEENKLPVESLDLLKDSEKPIENQIPQETEIPIKNQKLPKEDEVLEGNQKSLGEDQMPEENHSLPQELKMPMENKELSKKSEMLVEKDTLPQENEISGDNIMHSGEKDMLEENQKLPREDEKIPEENQEPPVDHQGLPEEHQALPEDHQTIPAENQELPEVHQTIPVENDLSEDHQTISKENQKLPEDYQTKKENQKLSDEHQDISPEENQKFSEDDEMYVENSNVEETEVSVGNPIHPEVEVLEENETKLTVENQNLPEENKKCVENQKLPEQDEMPLENGALDQQSELSEDSKKLPEEDDIEESAGNQKSRVESKMSFEQQELCEENQDIYVENQEPHEHQEIPIENHEPHEKYPEIPVRNQQPHEPQDAHVHFENQELSEECDSAGNQKTPEADEKICIKNQKYLIENEIAIKNQTPKVIMLEGKSLKDNLFEITTSLSYIDESSSGLRQNQEQEMFSQQGNANTSDKTGSNKTACLACDDTCIVHEENKDLSLVIEEKETFPNQAQPLYHSNERCGAENCTQRIGLTKDATKGKDITDDAINCVMISAAREDFEGTDFITSTPVENLNNGNNLKGGLFRGDTFLSPVSEISEETVALANTTMEESNSDDRWSNLKYTHDAGLVQMAEEKGTYDPTNQNENFMSRVKNQDKTQDINENGGDEMQDLDGICGDETQDLREVCEDETQDLKEICEDETQDLMKEVSEDETQDLKEICQDETQDLNEICQDETQDLKEIHEDETQDLNEICQDETQDFNEICEDETQDSRKVCEDETQDLDEICEDETQDLNEICEAETQDLREVCEDETQDLDEIHEDETQDLDKICEAETQDLREVCEDETQDLDEIHEDETQDLNEICEAETQDLREVCEDETQDLDEIHEDETQDLDKICEAETQDLREVCEDETQDLNEIHEDETHDLDEICVEETQDLNEVGDNETQDWKDLCEETQDWKQICEDGKPENRVTDSNVTLSTDAKHEIFDNKRVSLKDDDEAMTTNIVLEENCESSLIGNENKEHDKQCNTVLEITNENESCDEEGDTSGIKTNEISVERNDDVIMNENHISNAADELLGKESKENRTDEIMGGNCSESNEERVEKTFDSKSSLSMFEKNKEMHNESITEKEDSCTVELISKEDVEGTMISMQKCSGIYFENVTQKGELVPKARVEHKMEMACQECFSTDFHVNKHNMSKEEFLKTVDLKCVTDASVPSHVNGRDVIKSCEDNLPHTGTNKKSNKNVAEPSNSSSSNEELIERNSDRDNGYRSETVDEHEETTVLLSKEASHISEVNQSLICKDCGKPSKEQGHEINSLRINLHETSDVSSRTPMPSDDLFIHPDQPVSRISIPSQSQLSANEEGEEEKVKDDKATHSNEEIDPSLENRKLNSSSSDLSSEIEFKDEEELHLYWSQASSNDVSIESDSQEHYKGPQCGNSNNVFSSEQGERNIEYLSNSEKLEFSDKKENERSMEHRSDMCFINQDLEDNVHTIENAFADNQELNVEIGSVNLEQETNLIQSSAKQETQIYSVDQECTPVLVKERVMDVSVLDQNIHLPSQEERIDFDRKLSTSKMEQDESEHQNVIDQENGLDDGVPEQDQSEHHNVIDQENGLDDGVPEQDQSEHQNVIDQENGLDDGVPEQDQSEHQNVIDQENGLDDGVPEQDQSELQNVIVQENGLDDGVPEQDQSEHQNVIDQENGLDEGVPEQDESEHQNVIVQENGLDDGVPEQDQSEHQNVIDQENGLDEGVPEQGQSEHQNVIVQENGLDDGVPEQGQSEHQNVIDQKNGLDEGVPEQGQSEHQNVIVQENGLDDGVPEQGQSEHQNVIDQENGLDDGVPEQDQSEHQNVIDQENGLDEGVPEQGQSEHQNVIDQENGLDDGVPEQGQSEHQNVIDQENGLNDGILIKNQEADFDTDYGSQKGKSEVTITPILDGHVSLVNKGFGLETIKPNNGAEKDMCLESASSEQEQESAQNWDKGQKTETLATISHRRESAGDLDTEDNPNSRVEKTEAVSENDTVKGTLISNSSLKGETKVADLSESPSNSNVRLGLQDPGCVSKESQLIQKPSQVLLLEDSLNSSTTSCLSSPTKNDFHPKISEKSPSAHNCLDEKTWETLDNKCIRKKRGYCVEENEEDISEKRPRIENLESTSSASSSTPSSDIDLSEVSSQLVPALDNLQEIPSGNYENKKDSSDFSRNSPVPLLSQSSNGDSQTSSSDKSNKDSLNLSWSEDGSDQVDTNNDESKLVKGDTEKSEDTLVSSYKQAESSPSLNEDCFDIAGQRRKRKREKLNTAIVNELVNLDKEIRTALVKESPNITKAVSALEDVEDLPINESVLKKCPAVLETLSKCQKYKDSEQVRCISRDIYNKFQGIMKGSENKRPKY